MLKVRGANKFVHSNERQKKLNNWDVKMAKYG